MPQSAVRVETRGAMQGALWQITKPAPEGLLWVESSHLKNVTHFASNRFRARRAFALQM